MRFRTHTGEVVEGERLTAALHQVADEMERNAHAVRVQDRYASHVTTAQKDAYLLRALELAGQVRSSPNILMGFWLWQPLNTVLTGECVPFLPADSPAPSP